MTTSDDAGPFGKLSPELRERIRRDSAERRNWENDPANEVEGDFWFAVAAREADFQVRINRLKLGPIADMAKHDERLDILDGELTALKEDEAEVDQADPAERLTVMERVKSRWKERDGARAGRGRVTPQLAKQQASSASPAPADAVAKQPDADVAQWHAAWAKENPLASDEHAGKAARAEFPEKKITRQLIRDLRRSPDGASRRKGRKIGKPASQFR